MEKQINAFYETCLSTHYLFIVALVSSLLSNYEATLPL